MPSFTFEPTKQQLKDDTCFPIAIVKDTDSKGSKFHNKFLYLDTSDKRKGISKAEIPMGCIYNLMPNANKDKRDVFYIAGASGSGKSWIAKQLAENYIKMYPDRDVYVISKLEEDETLDSMDLGKKKPIRLDYSGWDVNPPNINSFVDCLIIADDFDTIEGKVGKAIQTFIDDIAIMGRQHCRDEGNRTGNITLLCLTHYLTNYKKTRLLLNEATHFVLYPQNTSSHGLYYLLKTHLGMDRDDIKKLKKLGRWCLMSKNYPQYLISSQYAEVLHQDD